MKPLAIQRSLSDAVADVVRDEIIDGKLQPGERLNEVHLANELNVSRTPVREALSKLVSEGFLSTQPRRGFFVRDMTDEDIEQLYGIRAILDPEALRMAGLPDPEQLQQLEDLNLEILASRGDPARIIEVDDQWHLNLISKCPNRILVNLIRQYILRTRPFEHAYMREHANVDAVVRDHRVILTHLHAGDLGEACQALHQNMQTAVAPLLAWRRSAVASRLTNTSTS